MNDRRPSYCSRSLVGDTSPPRRRTARRRLLVRLGGGLVVVDVRLSSVLVLLILQAVIMAVGELGVVVLVGVPVAAVLPAAERPALPVMVAEVIVVVSMYRRRVRVRPGFTFALRSLPRSGCGRHRLRVTVHGGHESASFAGRTWQKACRP